MMKKFCLSILILIIVGLAYVADAQELPPPYSDDVYITYYDDERPQALNDLLIFRNVCLETFIRLNPSVNIHYIPYSTQIRLPKNEACYDYSVVSNRNVYNSFSGMRGNVPLRLKFYEGGRWLDEPYYSVDVIYIGRDNALASYPNFPTPQEIADMYGVCVEDLLAENYLLHDYELYKNFVAPSIDVFIPLYLRPCYPENSPFMQNEDDFTVDVNVNTPPLLLSPEAYHDSDGVLYQSEPSDTVYDISKKFNVCVRDLLRVNPLIRQSLPQGILIRIPDVRPCYDETTGKQLIYEDNFGNPLPEPILSDYLIHYGQPIESYLSYYYNVCLNQIRAATQGADFDRLEHYAGYIIPTDRPPCYNPDNDWQPIEYVCYHDPIGHDTISQPTIEMTFDAEGAYCYDIQNPQTVIWYDNQPYKVFWKVDETLQLNSRAIQRGVLAWCFDVSLDEVNLISRNISFQPIQPSYFYGWIIPLPTRDCYLNDADILDGKITHTVEYGETLISIAQKYDVPYPMISVANQLWLGNVIWEGQLLIIPTASQTGDLWWLIPLWLFWGGAVLVFIRNVRGYLRQEKETNL